MRLGGRQGPKRRRPGSSHAPALPVCRFSTGKKKTPYAYADMHLHGARGLLGHKQKPRHYRRSEKKLPRSSVRCAVRSASSLVRLNPAAHIQIPPIGWLGPPEISFPPSSLTACTLEYLTVCVRTFVLYYRSSTAASFLARCGYSSYIQTSTFGLKNIWSEHLAIKNPT